MKVRRMWSRNSLSSSPETIEAGVPSRLKKFPGARIRRLRCRRGYRPCLNDACGLSWRFFAGRSHPITRAARAALSSRPRTVSALCCLCTQAVHRATGGFSSDRCPFQPFRSGVSADGTAGQRLIAAGGHLSVQPEPKFFRLLEGDPWTLYRDLPRSIRRLRGAVAIRNALDGEWLAGTSLRLEPIA